jgi:hypothetical protein
VVVSEFTSFSTETKVGYCRQLDATDSETWSPFVGFVLVFNVEGLSLIVGDSELGWGWVVTEVTSL